MWTFYLMLAPAAVLLLYMFQQLWAIRRYDKTLYRYMNIRHDLLEKVMEREGEMSREEYESLRLLIGWMDALIDGYDRHTEGVYNAWHIKEHRDELAATYKAMQEFQEKSEALKKDEERKYVREYLLQIFIAVGLAVLTHTRFALIGLLVVGGTALLADWTEKYREAAHTLYKTLFPDRRAHPVA